MHYTSEGSQWSLPEHCYGNKATHQLWNPKQKMKENRACVTSLPFPKKKKKKKKEYVNKKKKMSIYCFWYIFFFQLHTVTLWQCNIKKGNMTVKGNVSECHRPKRPDVASRQNEMQSLTIYDVKHHINYTGLVLVCHTVEWLEISTVTFTKDV